jgi:hypothetical protein
MEQKSAVMPPDGADIDALSAVIDLGNAAKGVIVFSGTTTLGGIKGKRLLRHRRLLPGLAGHASL